MRLPFNEIYSFEGGYNGNSNLISETELTETGLWKSQPVSLLNQIILKKNQPKHWMMITGTETWIEQPGMETPSDNRTNFSPEL